MIFEAGSYEGKQRMMERIDRFVLYTMLISTIIDMLIISGVESIRDVRMAGYLRSFVGIGYTIVFYRYLKDENYKLLYFTGSILGAAAVENGVFFLVDRYMPIGNLYLRTGSEGAVAALTYSYLYEYFKRCSYEGVRVFKERHNL